MTSPCACPKDQIPKTKLRAVADMATMKRISECYIKPKFDVKDASNPVVYFSPMELVLLAVHYNQKGLLYTKPVSDNSMANLLDNLKHSLSVALVHFYPLAGQLETRVDEDQHTSLVFINCSKGPGAKFIHASIDMKTSDILSPKYVPDVVQSSFFDLEGVINHEGHTKPLLSVQVTELIDGVFIGCSMNHMCADGNSFWHFFNTWSEIFSASGEGVIPISRPPIHKRWLPDGLGPLIKLPYTNPNEFITKFEAPNLEARFFHFSAESIAKLKAKVNSECGPSLKISSFQALSAFVWRSITRARRLQDNSETKCKFHIDYRRRVDPPLSQDYFGNMVQTTEGTCKAGELLTQNLSWAALMLNKAVAVHTREKVISVMEEWIKSPFVVNPESIFDPNLILIGSSPRFGMYGTQFGMGKALAVLSGYANKFDGKVICYPGREEEASIVMEVYLKSETMGALESDEEFMGVASGYLLS